MHHECCRGISTLQPPNLGIFRPKPEELKGWATSDVVHPDDLSRVIAAFNSSIETGHPYDSEHRCRRADGAYRWFQVRALPVRDTEGRVISWYILFTDIHDRKQAEDRLKLLFDVTNQVVSNLGNYILPIPTCAMLLESKRGDKSPPWLVWAGQH